MGKSWVSSLLSSLSSGPVPRGVIPEVCRPDSHRIDPTLDSGMSFLSKSPVRGCVFFMNIQLNQCITEHLSRLSGTENPTSLC